MGDPIEKQMFEGIQWKHDGRRSSMPKEDNSSHLKVIQVKRFLFESALKRMATIVNIDDGKSSGGGDYKVLCKGAPEVVKQFLT